MSTNRKHKTQAKRSAAAPVHAAQASEVNNLQEMFPDWSADDLTALLNENADDVEIVIDLIVNGKAAKWEPIKKEPKKKIADTTDPVRDTAPLNTRKKAPVKKPATKKPVVKKDARKDVRKEATAKEQDIAVGTEPVAANGGSWAAALAQEKKKPAPKKAPDAKKEVQKDSRPDSNKEEIKEKPQPAAVAAATIAAAANPVSVPDPEAVASSWASMVTPKPKIAKKPVQKSTTEKTEEPQPQEQISEPVVQVVPVVEQIETTVVAETVEEPAVILPSTSAGLNNVGVTFGSLSLEENTAEKEEVNYLYNQAAQSQNAQPAAQAPAQQPSASAPAQPAAGSDQRFNNSNQYYQNFNQKPHDYYNQYPAQQQTQQFPQQSQPGQYGGYPVDYSNYNAQLLAAQQLAAAQAQRLQGQPPQTPGQGQGTPSGASEATQSPVTLNQQIPQQYQYPGQQQGQQPISQGSAQSGNSQPQQPQGTGAGIPPFGYPGYYNYYYSQPYYNQAGSQNGFSSPNVSNASTGNYQAQQPQQTQAAPQAQTSQYGRYPYPQNGEEGGSVAQSQPPQQLQTPTQIPGQPMMPQYAAYQQYPQFGGYQDTNQYRWY